jgi:hypothetical protein
VVGDELEVVVECGSHLEHRADGRVSAGVGEKATDDLRLHRHPPGEFRLRDPAGGPRALKRANEGVGRRDLRTCDLVLLAERGVAELLIEELVETGLARHGNRNLYAT